MDTVEELALHSKSLNTAIKANPQFFASVAHYIERLFQLTTDAKSELTQKELRVLAERIEDFFKKWRAAGDSLFLPPRETADTDSTVIEINRLVEELCDYDPERFAALVRDTQSEHHDKTITREEFKPCVFIGHGRDSLWAKVKLFLDEDLGLATITYESEPRTGEAIVEVLDKMLDQATFAVLVVTAEDQTAEGNYRARQNVVHEVGLFQGRLGFKRVALLYQEGVEGFSNIAGLQYVPFTGDKIDQAFWELRRVLVREGQIP